MSLTIAVVDDDRDILDLVRTVLEMEEYRVIAVSQAEELEARLRGERPSLFLLDIMLQHTSGIELAQAIGAQGHGTVPMIGMSASPFMVRLAAQSGAFVATIEKPFEIDALLRLVEGALERRGHSPQAC